MGVHGAGLTSRMSLPVGRWECWWCRGVGLGGSGVGVSHGGGEERKEEELPQGTMTPIVPAKPQTSSIKFLNFPSSTVWLGK